MIAAKTFPMTKPLEETRKKKCGREREREKERDCVMERERTIETNRTMVMYKTDRSID